MYVNFTYFNPYNHNLLLKKKTHPYLHVIWFYYFFSPSQKQPNQTSTDPSKPGEVKTPPATTPTAPSTLAPQVPETPTTADVKPPLGSVSTDIKDSSSSKDNEKVLQSSCCYIFSLMQLGGSVKLSTR